MSSTTKCPSARLNRRNLLTAGIAAALLAPRTRASGRGGVEYTVDREANAIRVLGAGVEIQKIGSPAPVAVAVHPNGRFVYVVNGIGEYENLPRGTVEAYRVTAEGLRHTATTRLSLSGTFPSDIAISPDGKYAIVAIAGGRAYNVLRVAGDGRLEAPSQIVKRYGVEPERVAFSPAGDTVYGGGREVFAFRNGILSV